MYHENRLFAVQFFLNPLLAERGNRKNAAGFSNCMFVEPFPRERTEFSGQRHVQEHDVVNRAINRNVNAGRNVAVGRDKGIAIVDFFCERARKEKCLFYGKCADVTGKQRHIFCFVDRLRHGRNFVRRIQTEQK